MNIGEKIRRLRVLNGLTQEELANRSELTKGFISQLERDLTSPSIATLIDILQSLGTNLKEFFSDDLPQKVVFTKGDFFVKTDEQLSSTVQWIVPDAQKNLMEPIIIDLEPCGCSESHEPHEGEEFGYVLKGSVFVILGKEKFKAKHGECFYFRSSITHRIANAGKSRASVLWLTTPPSF